MTTTTHSTLDTQNTFYVVHPLDDAPETKRSAEGLGLMPLSRSVRFSLLALRGYLIIMGLLVFYHVLSLAGAFGHGH